MDLYPRDLGTERYLAMMRRRLAPFAGAQNGASPLNLEDDENKGKRRFRLRRGRRLRRYWVKDLQLDEETSEKLGTVLWRGAPGINVRVGAIILSIYLIIPMIITGAAGAPGFVPFMLFLIWQLAFWAVLLSPRQALKRLHEKKLTANEIETLLPTARGRLERSYLQLLLDAMQTNLPTTSAQEDIRAALRDLGDVISHLPANGVPAVEPDTLRREALEARQKAQAEPDSFVRASLLRQAEAFEKRAALSDENIVSARRFSALRREARLQMDTLRQVLVAFQQTSHSDAVGITHLTETVSRVAREAQAASIAHRELEEDEIARLLGSPLPSNLPRQPVAVPAPVQPVTPTQPTEQPQPQIIQSRNWWRNP